MYLYFISNFAYLWLVLMYAGTILLIKYMKINVHASKVTVFYVNIKFLITMYIDFTR